MSLGLRVEGVGVRVYGFSAVVGLPCVRPPHRKAPNLRNHERESEKERRT